jgi:transcriptional regulator with XRE-family HTH domain
MTESERLIATIKSLLKKKGFTYRAIADEWGVSEQTIKRMFSKETFTLDRLVRLASLVDMSLAEVAESASEAVPRIRALTLVQEKELVADPKLLLVAACALNNWTVDAIVGRYKFTRAECLKCLLRLDRLGLITLLPGDRIRLNVARDFDWLPQGPIQAFFRRQEKDAFLDGGFAGSDENFFFVFGMLSPPARKKLQAQLARLRADFAELHQESLSAPFEQRSSACLMVAQREWEPASFARMRRS